MEQNPLRKYFRAVKLYTTLPSGTSYYPSEVVEFNEAGEVGVLALTAKDEVVLKNPDALLNGEAIIEIIKSCVPSVKQPTKLLTNDIDALVVAIRHATQGDDIELKTECPSCKAENDFALNISLTLGRMGHLESEYKITTKYGITLYARPFAYSDAIKVLKLQFDQNRAAKSITNEELPEEQRLKIFSESYKKIAATNLELLTGTVSKITFVDPDTNEEVVVTNPKHIQEFLYNSDKATFTALDTLVKDLNAIGVGKKYPAQCRNCQHNWEAEIDFNPVNFFTDT